MHDERPDPSNSPSQEPGQWESVDAAAYDQKWLEMEAAGEPTHGEVDFVVGFSPASVLDAGCGSGRVAIELARRGVDVVGVDLDQPFIEAARTKAPELDFRLDDLRTVDVDRTFDVVVMAGNVMIFVTPGTEAEVVANMAKHVAAGGYLIAGFQLGHGLTVDAYDAAARDAGLEPHQHWSTWDGDEPNSGSDYAVFVHQRAANVGSES